MRVVNLLVTVLITLVICGCELDSFMFNTEQLEQYSLPGNSIPDSLIEHVTFESGSNTLHGFWVKSNASHFMSSVTILYCHGNKHNIDYYWDRVEYLHNTETNVFVFDYRGFGLSEGESSEQGLYEDGVAALDYLCTRPDFSLDSLCLYGFSLGNVVSIYLASEIVDPMCLIAEAPFASANSLTQGSALLDLPGRWLTDGRFDNVEKIKNIDTYFYLIFGDHDDFVRPYDNGRVIWENAPMPKMSLVVPFANHENIPETIGITEYISLISYWIFWARPDNQLKGESQESLKWSLN